LQIINHESSLFSRIYTLIQGRRGFRFAARRQAEQFRSRTPMGFLRNPEWGDIPFNRHFAATKRGEIS
jgi:hypothetical protein